MSLKSCYFLYQGLSFLSGHKSGHLNFHFLEPIEDMGAYKAKRKYWCQSYRSFFTKDFFCIFLVSQQYFNATRHPRHIEAAAIVMNMYLYGLVFMDHPYAFGAAVCHQALPCPLYTQPRTSRVWTRHTNGLKIVSTGEGFKPTISLLKVECSNP